MTTMVGIPKEKVEAGLADIGKIEDLEGRQVMSRIIIDRVRQWIEDPTRDELVNYDRGPNLQPALSPEEMEKRVKAGAGVFGISTVIEPTNLELYRSYMYPPLSMPEKPEVMISYWDMNNPVVPFLEGRVMVKAMCPDGKESWLVISVPVPNFHTALEGNCWGWPKYVADEMTVTPTKAEVIYEGEVRLSLELTPGGLDEATEKELKERGRFEMGNTVSFHVHKGGGCLMRQTGRGGGPPKVTEWQTGMVKVYVMPQEPWAGLIPANSVTPGVYQKFIGTGGGDSVFQKIKG